MAACSSFHISGRGALDSDRSRTTCGTPRRPETCRFQAGSGERKCCSCDRHHGPGAADGLYTSYSASAFARREGGVPRRGLETPPSVSVG